MTYQVENQIGKRFIITGANSGTGFEATKRITAAGGEVIMAVRSLERGEKAKAEILSVNPQARLEIRQLDLADLTSVRVFAESVKSDGKPLHTLINNAGLMNTPQRFETTDDFELQLGTNFIGPFSLTLQLLPKLLETENIRVTTMASAAANFGHIDLEDLNWEKRSYNPLQAYCQSKLADLLIARQLGEIAKAKGWSLKSTAAHPGFTRTNLQTTGANMGKSSDKQAQPSSSGILQPVSRAVEGELFAATADNAEQGAYYGPRFLMYGDVHRCHTPRSARSLDLAEKLWTEAEKLTGLSLNQIIK